MSGSGGLTGAPLRAGLDFNWVFLVELAVCGILAIFFLFYFNRVFATIVSYGLRAWTWHRYRVYVDIQALQISLLGGRVFFKGFRYHGNNETILIHSGFITWCYWLRNVRELDISHYTNSDAKRVVSGGKPDHDSLGGEELGGRKDRRKPPCRLNVSLNGAEWFVYNRSAAYDAIVTELVGEEEPNNCESRSSAHQDHDDPTRVNIRTGVTASQSKHAGSCTDPASGSKEGSPVTEKSSFSIDAGNEVLQEFLSTSGGGSEDRAGQAGDTDSTFILRLLPIHVHCTKAAVVLGNENTRSVLIAKADGADGEIDATNSTVLDQYRQLINFVFDHPVVQMKPNDDFKEDQTTAASRVKQGDGDRQDNGQHHPHTHSFLHRQRRKFWHRLQDLVPAFQSSVESLSSSTHDSHRAPSRPGPDSNRWQGLSRYLDESEQDDKAKWSAIEYATVSTIADCPEASMSFYWDVVGTVPERLSPSGKMPANINGDPPPEWGIDLSFKGATINYGPWADRQRADIQRVFFPSLCKDAHRSKHLFPGQFRVPTEFKLNIVFDEETTLRVPIREESKNWKWTKMADTMGARPDDHTRNGKANRKKKIDKGNPGPEIRPFGWLDVKVGANAAITYTMDMIAGPSGFKNKLKLDLPNTEITTSVNHGLLWRSTETRLSCDLSNPLQWNGQRTWHFDVLSNGLELFILREHVFLLLDLVDDWAGGPPPEFLTFTPFLYLVNLQLGDFRLYLNVNDSNIVNNPSDFDDNTYIIIFGAVLDAAIHIPLKNYRPYRNDICFDVNARRGGLNLHVPPWNTQATFLSSTELATLQELNIDGTYQYCSTTSSSNTDTLLLNVHGRAPSALFYGFVIRYFLKVKDNYFGDDIRFKTLDEYQDILRARSEGGGECSLLPPHKKSNDLDVILSIAADESSVILPSNLYSAKNHIRIDIATLAADLRFTNYYMDLECALGSLAFSQASEVSDAATPTSASSTTQLFVDGLKFSGNRLFGLPPTEPTYMCNWDFAVGAITGDCTTDFLTRLAGGVKAFAFSFDDDENALPSISEIVLHDVTFLAASVDAVHIWLHVEEAAFLLSTAAISITFNDWAGSHYSKKVNLLIPDLQFGCVDAESASRHRSRAQHAVETHAFLQTTLSFAMIQRKLGFKEDRQLQQQHVKRHDQRTHRTEFLLHHGLYEAASPSVPVDPPAQCVPPIPLPIVQQNLDRLESHSFNSKTSSPRTRNAKAILNHKSSFLSPSNSSIRSQESILRPRSLLRMTQTPTAESRSRSLHTNASHKQQRLPREHSTSTGRQSSFYSALGEGRGHPPISVAISSSFMAPNFPLEGVEPDVKDLPTLPEPSHLDPFADIKQLSLGDVRPDRVDNSYTHTSFIVEFPAGVSGVFSPEAAHAVASLLGDFQAVDPVDLLDELQMECMNEIFDTKRQKSLTGEVVDLSMRVSEISLRFLNSSTSQRMKHSHQDMLMLDQYDVSISGLAITSRSETSAVQSEGEEAARKSSVAYISLRTANFAAKERYSDIDDPQAAVHAVLEDVVFWHRQNHETSASVAFKGFNMATNSSKLEYLASLIHRTEALGSELAATFTDRIKQQRNRVRLFTYLVARAGQQAPDPLFLTRPSYVLRSAPDHLRTTDSWKIVTRLHHMYSSLHVSTRDEITSRILSHTENVPADAEEKVREGFDQWRSWDLNNMNTCRVMGRVYGSKPAAEAPILSPKPLKVSFKTENIRLVLDPGPKQNEISLNEISASFESTTSWSTADVGPYLANQYVESLFVQVFCADMAVGLNWELCELTEDILRLYHRNPRSSLPIDEAHVTPASIKKDRPKRKLHLLLATDKGSIMFDAINVRATSLSEGLKASFILLEDADNGVQKMGCLMLTAEAATSNIKSHSQNLSVFQMKSPSVYASYDTQMVDHGPVNAAKVAGNCQQLSFVLRQDVLALIELVDLVIGDELLQLSNIKGIVPKGWSNLSSSPKKSTPMKISIALFLDEYQISIPLLPSLTYNVSGVVARASIAAQLGSEMIFDFDIKENSHDIQTVVDDQPKSISLLQLPPTNGRITSHMSDEENSISIIASVEPVELDAAAVHSLLTALNRPEISSVARDVQEDLKLIHSHFREVYGPVKETPTTSPLEKAAIGIPLSYDAHFTLAGLDIFANAQGQDGEGANGARLDLDLNLGCIQFVLANRLDVDGPILEFPELRVSLRQIMFELSRWNNGSMEPCGNLAFAAHLIATSKLSDAGSNEVRSLHMNSDGLEINLFADTASSVVDLVGHLQDKIKDLDLSREKKYLRKLRKSKPRSIEEHDQSEGSMIGSSVMFGDSMYSLELLNIRISWLVGTYEEAETDNLVLSLKRIDLSTKKVNAARLTIEDLQLQIVPASQDKTQRSLNSALLPEVIFNVGFMSTLDARRLAFQAAGKSLDLRLTSQFMIPASALQRSITSASEKLRSASATWSGPRVETTRRRQPFWGKKRMESLLVDADFAGAVVYLSGKKLSDHAGTAQGIKPSRAPQAGRYGQFTHTDTSNNTILRAPGLAWKIEYKDSGTDDPSLNAEVKVDASTNILYPSVVPLIMEISSTVKEVVSDDDAAEKPPLQAKTSPQKFMVADEENILTADPSAVLGRTRLNLGLRICRQEFSLSCQPIARVAATARFDDIYITINTVRSTEHGHFFAASAAFTRLQASVQHVYSRESTASFDVESVFLSLMNSKHVSGTSGISAILKISPMKVLVNAKQLQDFLLFREIWVPPEIRQSASNPAATINPTLQSQTYLVQRYQQVAATGAFPWNATVSIAELDVQLDLGQAIGKSAFIITQFWISSKKNSDWEQNLCLGFDKIGIDSTGRMSGFVALQNFKVRTSIQWPAREMALNQTPLVQGSVGFSQLRIKAAFDYQAFLVADITSFKFMMYNVRDTSHAQGDRLVAILDGESVQVFCTTTSASQGLALYQAFQRLVQEKRTNYEASLSEIEKYMKRKSVPQPAAPHPKTLSTSGEEERASQSPISLHTDVIVTLKAVNMGAFPNTFLDHQVFKLEALDAQARFAVTMDQGKIHSILGLTLGQLRIGLAGVKKVELPKSVGEISVDDVVSSATGSRGGTILKVPKVEATMQTWQVPSSNHIDYVFKSSFEGKVEVGWNYSRIGYIRGMWAAHSKALAQRLGKPLPPSAVKITGVPDEEGAMGREGEKQKFTAEVNVPQSKYNYTALEPPIIETPQLRDMGEATPPLEWIGLHRERLPNLTHQIVIVTLLELASEIEDAYGKILGK